jgi:hypothetical protein
MLLPRITFMPESGEGKMPTRQDRRDNEERLLAFWTNFSLVTAVGAGLVIAWAHGGIITASITAFAGALGLGGVLGFLFGVPSPKTASNPNPAPAQPQTHVPPPVPHPIAAPAPEGQAQIVVAAAVVAPLVQVPQVPVPDHPAVPANAAPVPAPAVAQTPSSIVSGPTSNLEQVADWVTKLLLGGGLTQISKIPPKIWQWAHAAAVGIVGDTSKTALVDATQPFAAGLLVYGFVLGFFGGFLITKLQLGKAISS